MTSCYHRDKTTNNITSIEVTFIKGNLEKPLPLSCGGLAIMSGSILKDTILLDLLELNEIEHQLKHLKVKEIDSTVHDCDVRIHCQINFKDKKTSKLCIGQLNCIIQDNVRIIENDTLVYLIKKEVGYYNYFPKNELDYFRELANFGVPNNYKDLSRTKKLNLQEPPPPPQ